MSSSTVLTFSERFAGAEDYFKPRDDIEPDPIRGLAIRRTNLIPDIVNTDLPLDNRRSPGYRRVEPFMAGKPLLFVDRPARDCAVAARDHRRDTSALSLTRCEQHISPAFTPDSDS